MYYELKINQVCRVAPAKESWSVWEKELSKHSSIEEVKKKLVEIYGKVPFRKGNEIYIDMSDGDHQHIGYHFSYWEYLYDRSKPPDSKYWATDWISVMNVSKNPVSELFLTNGE